MFMHFNGGVKLCQFAFDFLQSFPEICVLRLGQTFLPSTGTGAYQQLHTSQLGPTWHFSLTFFGVLCDCLSIQELPFLSGKPSQLLPIYSSCQLT